MAEWKKIFTEDDFTSGAGAPVTPGTYLGQRYKDTTGGSWYSWNGSSWDEEGSGGGGSGDITEVIAGTGLTGGATTGAATLNVAANADGSIVVNADDIQVGVLATDAQHGNRGGGALHNVATTGTAGFMSAADKSAIDALGTAANADTGTTSGTVPTYDGSSFLNANGFTANDGTNACQFDGTQITPYNTNTVAFTIGGVTVTTGAVQDIAILGNRSGQTGVKGGKTEVWGGGANNGDGGNLSLAAGVSTTGGVNGIVEVGGSDGTNLASEIRMLKGFSIYARGESPPIAGATSGKGQLWTRTSDGALMYTTPAGVDTDLTANGGGGTWGSITGTLSNQTDLQSALDGKEAAGAVAAHEAASPAHAASAVSYDPTGTNLVATTAQAAISELDLETIKSDTFANRSGYQTAGTFFYATDTLALYYYTGVAWQTVSVNTLAQLGAGTLSDLNNAVVDADFDGASAGDVVVTTNAATDGYYLKYTTASGVQWAEGGGSSSTREKAIRVIGAGGLAADTAISANSTGDTLLAYADAADFVTNFEVYVNGDLMRNGVDAAANYDVYPTTTPDFAFEFALNEGDVVQVLKNGGGAGGGVTDHTLLSNIGTNTHAQIDTHIADGTVHFTEGSIDHGSIGGLADDDHTIYSLADGTRAYTGPVTISGASSAITLGEHGTAPGTPAAGNVAVYAKADGKLYIKDDAGTETDLTAGGGGGSVYFTSTHHFAAFGGNWTTYPTDGGLNSGSAALSQPGATGTFADALTAVPIYWSGVTIPAGATSAVVDRVTLTIINEDGAGTVAATVIKMAADGTKTNMNSGTTDTGLAVTNTAWTSHVLTTDTGTTLSAGESFGIMVGAFTQTAGGAGSTHHFRITYEMTITG